MDFIIIPAITELEMPSPCFDCKQIFELNSLASCSDGEIRCQRCNKEWIEDFEEAEFE
jgi:hypothetical protein